MTPKQPPLSIDIRHPRIRGGRLHISAGTANRKQRDRYVQDIHELLADGRFFEIEQLRQGKITLGDVRAAIREKDPALLRPHKGGPLTIEAALTRVLKVVAAQGVEGTSREYRTVASLIRQHFGAATELASVTEEAAQTFLQAVKSTNSNGKPWSAGRQSVVRALCARIWGDEIRHELNAAKKSRATPRLTDNPWKAVRLPRVRPTRFAFLEPSQWRDVQRAASGTPAAAFLGFGCLAGLRMMEAANLRRGVDVDLDRRVLRVQARDGEYAWRPKTERGDRTVRIGSELLALVEAHIASGFAGERYLFVLPGRDRPISAPTFQKWTRTALTAAGLSYGRSGASLTHHSLRHTFASWLVQRDVNPMKVAKLIGDTPEMVLRIYGHLGKTDLETAIEIVDNIARGEASP